MGGVQCRVRLLCVILRLKQLLFRIFAFASTASGYNLALSLRGAKTKDQVEDPSVFWLRMTVYEIVQLLYVSVPAVLLYDEVLSKLFLTQITILF